MKKYSHPNFFMEEWIKEQEKDYEELKLERKKRRKEKAAARSTDPILIHAFAANLFPNRSFENAETTRIVKTNPENEKS